MTDFRHSRQHEAEWDGYTERRSVASAGSPGDPVTREYLDNALRENRHSTREFVGNKFSELEELIRDGFPDGNTTKHREVHEGFMRRAEDRAAFWKSVWEKIATGMIYAAVVAVGTAVWQYVKSEAHKP